MSSLPQILEPFAPSVNGYYVTCGVQPHGPQFLHVTVLVDASMPPQTRRAIRKAVQRKLSKSDQKLLAEQCSPMIHWLGYIELIVHLKNGRLAQS